MRGEFEWQAMQRASTTACTSPYEGAGPVALAGAAASALASGTGRVRTTTTANAAAMGASAQFFRRDLPIMR